MSDASTLSKLTKIEHLLRALISLQVKHLAVSDPDSKPELIISSSGLTHQEIADLIGKTSGAVAKAISRAK